LGVVAVLLGEPTRAIQHRVYLRATANNLRAIGLLPTRKNSNQTHDQ
jgi:hypothetical protein